MISTNYGKLLPSINIHERIMNMNVNMNITVSTNVPSAKSNAIHTHERSLPTQGQSAQK